MTIQAQADDILAFWFGALQEDGWSGDDRQPLWFAARQADDDEMRARYGALIDSAVRGALRDWEAHSDAARMALLLLTDQMTRAVYRGTAQAFAGDAVALRVCQDGIADGYHRRLPAAWRRFYYLPLEHSESIADQEQCIKMFQQLQADYPQYHDALEESIRYAVSHYDIIKRFGRFPHRNRALGRDSTDEELTYLRDSNQHFGQKAPA